MTGDALLRSVAAALAEDSRLNSENHRFSSAESQLARLTEREDAVMRLVVAGLSNKEVAKHLGISHRTVEIHKAHLMKKLGASTLVDLLRIARDADLD
ncbi:response regulator transcription factor [Dechloromonas sp.]|uniref:response regulator transcription factor n=1 Tax=Dechloromonas sp. TaxID=1917218 RepID=UPI00263F8F4D|nr:LuxR C-terminal-related transcriptional regulator [Dechloromonas sp.]